MNDEKTNKIMSSEELDDALPKYEPIKLSGKNLAQNYVSAFNTGMNIYQCVNYLQGNIDWTIKAVNDVVKSWNTEVSESIDQSKAIVRETTTEQFNTEWTNKQPQLIEQVNTLTTNQFNEDWGVLENRINTTLETQNTNINEQNTKINSIQTQQTNLASQQTNLASQQTNLASQQTTLSNRMDTFTSLSEGSTTGDAELKDIRVGADGITYNTAGDSVRGQYSQLKEDLVNHMHVICDTILDKCISSYVDIYDSKADERLQVAAIKNSSGLCELVERDGVIATKFDIKDGILTANGVIKDDCFRFLAVNDNNVVLATSNENYFIIPKNTAYVWINRDWKNKNNEFYVKKFENPSKALTEVISDNIEIENIIKSYFGSCIEVDNSIFRVMSQVAHISGTGNIVKEGYQVYSTDVSYGEVYVVTCENDGEVKHTLFIEAEDGTPLIEKYQCNNTIISIPQNGKRMIINRSWKNCPEPLLYKKVMEKPRELYQNKVFYCGSTREFTKITDVVKEATKYMNSIIYVDGEEFDIIEEYGQAYLDSNNSDIGMILKNNVHIICASGCKFIFNYQGTNEYIHKMFSPFNSGKFGFILENAWIESKNCRYSVHDERNSESDFYDNKYLECTMIHDSSQSSWGPHQAIGGGLGLHGNILIDGGYYESVGNDNTVSYHNAVATGVNSKSKVVIKNAHIKGYTLCANYGSSTEKSQMIVNGCLLGSEPQLEKVITTDRADNMELITWNNVIRG